MLKNFSKKWAAKKGFTLIELLVVIAIIGVLASIVLASLNNARKKARDTRRITDIKQIQLALELYFDGQNSQYPVATATCTATPDTTIAGENLGLQDLALKGYIPQIPRDAGNSATCYKYASAAPLTSYHLGATMEDGSTGNQALKGDKDCNSTVAGGATGCGPAAFTEGFNGADPVFDAIP